MKQRLDARVLRDLDDHFATGEVMPTKVLGEFMSTWKGGVSIGSDPKCVIVLEGLAPVAAIVLAASNHKFLYRHGSPHFAAAVVYTGGPLPPNDDRVDYRAFDVGGYILRFGESYRNVTAE